MCCVLYQRPPLNTVGFEHIVDTDKMDKCLMSEVNEQ